MELNSYFTDFLSEIRLPDDYVDECRKAHETLRQRLEQDPELSKIIVSTFLQGSYKRDTIIRPDKDAKADVDVVVVTKLNKDEYSPDKAFDVFIPFLEKHYKDKYQLQGRSIGIHLKYIDLDLVITATPSESQWGILQSPSVKDDNTLSVLTDWSLNKQWIPPASRSKDYKNPSNEEWKSEPLYIPDRERKTWERTHPLAQIQWTRDKNKRCNGHYVNVVKAVKWWYRHQKNTPKYPKGYLIEALVGFFCPDGIKSVSEGFLRTLKALVTGCTEIVSKGQTPFLADHAIPERNVFARITPGEFNQFYQKVDIAAKVAQEAYDSDNTTQCANKWRNLLGDDFPNHLQMTIKEVAVPVKEAVVLVKVVVVLIKVVTHLGLLQHRYVTEGLHNYG